MTDTTGPFSTPAERLKHARISAGFTSAMGAAKYFEWKPSTYASHENGGAAIRPFWAELYGQAFRVSPRWILSGEDDPSVMPSKGTKLASLARSSTTNINPVAPPSQGLGAAARFLRAGTVTMLNVYGWRRNDENEIITDFTRMNDAIATPPNLMGVEEAYAALIADSAMSPRVRPGDTILVNPTKPARPGDLVMVISPQGKAGLLREYVGEDPNGFMDVVVRDSAGKMKNIDLTHYSLHRVVGVYFD